MPDKGSRIPDHGMSRSDMIRRSAERAPNGGKLAQVTCTLPDIEWLHGPCCTWEFPSRIVFDAACRLDHRCPVRPRRLLPRRDVAPDAVRFLSWPRKRQQ